MVNTFKYLLLVAVVIFAAVAHADGRNESAEGDRRRDLGDARRDTRGIVGDGFRAFKVTRITTTGTDTLVFSFRAFPVPRIRVRYFEGTVADSDVESNSVTEKLELIAAIPGFFLYTDGDNTAGYSSTTLDSITQKFNLRRANGDSWSPPSFEVSYVDSVQVGKLTVCRKVNDFCFVSYVANASTTFEGYPLTADAVKFNVIINPGSSSSLTLTAEERLAVVVKVHYKSGLTVEDRSRDNAQAAAQNQTQTENDLLIGSSADAVSTYFNWDKFVTVTYTDSSSASLSLIANSFTVDQLDFDRPISGAGLTRDGGSVGGGDDSSSGSSDFNETSSESDSQRATRDGASSYGRSQEDGAVSGRLNGDKILVFAIDGSLANATQIVWDPASGAAAISVSTSGVAAVSMTVVKVLIAAFAIFALFM